jgi:hypothetical protein
MSYINKLHCGTDTHTYNVTVSRCAPLTLIAVVKPGRRPINPTQFNIFLTHFNIFG